MAQTSTRSGSGSTMRAVPNAGFDAWVDGAKARARARGISAGTVDRAFRGVGYLPGVVERDRNQTEFVRSFEDYIAIAASDERIAKGRAAFGRHRATLNRLEQSYGVDAEIICAIWGLESSKNESESQQDYQRVCSTEISGGGMERSIEFPKMPQEQ